MAITKPVTQTSGRFTVTLTGCTTAVTGTLYWHRVGDLVIVSTRSAEIVGTSNAATFTLTGWPAKIYPPSDRWTPFKAYDAGSWWDAQLRFNARSTGIVTCAATELGAATWTASGSKGIAATTFVYTLDNNQVMS